MKFISVCSGIEAASVAWNPLGWEALCFSEIEKFPSAVLNHHYTQIPYGKKPSTNCPDGPRYKALGNSWAVPVFRWVGERIAMVDAQAITSLQPWD